jgi:hypothetical protein
MSNLSVIGLLISVGFFCNATLGGAWIDLPVFGLQNDNQLCFTHIKKFDSNGNYILGWGPTGSLDSQFLHIHDIAVDRSGNIYATDEQK